MKATALAAAHQKANASTRKNEWQMVEHWKRKTHASGWMRYCGTCMLVASLYLQSLAATHEVNSAEAIGELIESQSLLPGDVLIWSNGEYSDQEIELNGLNGTPQKPVTLRAASPGGVILLGESQIRTNARWWVIEGFHFKGTADRPSVYNPIQFRGKGDIGAEHVRLHDCAFTNLRNGANTAKWVQIYGRFNRVDHCHFSGKPNKGALMTIELGGLGEAESAEHVIEWNYFSDVAQNEGSDNETIRIGFSGDQNRPAKCVVQHNLFERCDGEPEIISNKSSYNTYVANTFRKCNGSLVLRHGHHATVQGNYFFGDGASDAGGIRINDSHHRIFNNYMKDLTGLTWNAALSIEGGNKVSGSDSSGYQAVDGLIVAHNSIVDCAKSIFLNDKHGKRTPIGVFANNLIVARDAKHKLLDARLSFAGIQWRSNLFFGSALIPDGVANNSVRTSDPRLVLNGNRFRPGRTSPAIDAAGGGFAFVEHDIEGRVRPATGRDIGADELAKLPVATSRRLPLDTNQVGVTFFGKIGPITK